jgi:hypothetical protein
VLASPPQDREFKPQYCQKKKKNQKLITKDVK